MKVLSLLDWSYGQIWSYSKVGLTWRSRPPVTVTPKRSCYKLSNTYMQYFAALSFQVIKLLYKQKISAMFYFHPFFPSDLRANLKLEWGCPDGTSDKIPPVQPTQTPQVMHLEPFCLTTHASTDRQTDEETGWFQLVYIPLTSLVGGGGV